MGIDIDVRFPGGKRVDTVFKNFTIATDQPQEEGGQGTAPEPFDFFFVSIAACAGIYALEFCTSRDLKTHGLKIRLVAEKDEGIKLFSPIRISLSLPDDFPDKYRKPIVRAVNMCTVKRHIESHISINTVIEN